MRKKVQKTNKIVVKAAFSFSLFWCTKINIKLKKLMKMINDKNKFFLTKNKMKTENIRIKTN